MTVIGCDKDDENTETNVDGNYIGVFERAGNTSDVELSINNGTWTGESETEKFPDLCNGHYSISGNIITFENACPWTAEFDWSLILSDDWNYPYKWHKCKKRLAMLIAENGLQLELIEETPLSANEYHETLNSFHGWSGDSQSINSN